MQSTQYGDRSAALLRPNSQFEDQNILSFTGLVVTYVGKYLKSYFLYIADTTKAGMELFNYHYN